jgi:hypothetical protein
MRLQSRPVRHGLAASQNCRITAPSRAGPCGDVQERYGTIEPKRNEAQGANALSRRAAAQWHWIFGKTQCQEGEAGMTKRCEQGQIERFQFRLPVEIPRPD